MASSIADLSLGRSAIDFVGKHDVSENRPALKFENFAPRGIVGQHIGPGNVGRHQIGGELNAGKTETEDLSQTAHHQGFPNPRHSFEQTVAAANQRDKNLFDQFFMADDNARHLGFDLLKRGARPLHARLNILNGIHEPLLSDPRPE